MTAKVCGNCINYVELEKDLKMGVCSVPLPFYLYNGDAPGYISRTDLGAAFCKTYQPIAVELPKGCIVYD